MNLTMIFGAIFLIVGVLCYGRENQLLRNIVERSCNSLDGLTVVETWLNTRQSKKWQKLKKIIESSEAPSDLKKMAQSAKNFEIGFYLFCGIGMILLVLGASAG